MRPGRFRQGGASGQSLAQRLPEYLDRTTYVLLLSCLVFVTFAFSFKTNSPFDPIKEMLFLLFVLLTSWVVVVGTVLTHRFPVKINLIHILVVLYLTYNALSFATSRYADRAYLVDLVLLVLFFFCIAAVINSQQRYADFLFVIALMVLACSIYGFIQFLGLDLSRFGDPFGERTLGPRIFSFWGSPNFYAAFLLMCLPLCLTGHFTRMGAGKHVFTGAIALGGVSLLQTGTRAALPGACISIPLFLAMTQGEASKKRFLGLTCAVAALVGIGFLFSATVNDTGMNALHQRQHLWQSALRIAQDYPLLGSGVGSFNVYYPTHSTQSATLAFEPLVHEMRTEHAHNEFLEILSDLGILGFLLFLGILLSFFLDCYERWDGERKYVIAGSVCAIVGILVDNLFSVNLRFSFVSMFFWLCLALPSALRNSKGASREVSLSTAKIVGCLLPLPLLATFFMSHSLGRYRADHYFREGLTAYNQAGYQQAEVSFERGLENNPQDKWIFYFLGQSQYRLGKFEESKQTLLKLTELDPNFLQVHYWLGNNYYRMGDFENARVEYNESLKINDVYGPSYYSLALIFLRENNIEQGLSYLEKASTVESDYSTENIRLKALEKLVELHRQLGNSEQAGTYAKELHKLKAGTR